MSDYLDPKMVDKCLSGHYPSLWSSTSHRVLYCQLNTEGDIELYGNSALGFTPPLRMLAAIGEHQLTSWITMLKAIGVLSAVIVAGQDLYAKVLNYAKCDNWKVRIKRIAREGDCQADSNFGTNTEERMTKRILSKVDSAERQVVVIKVLGTELFLLQANFCWNEMAFSTLKSCRTLTDLCEIVIPQLVARKGITKVIFGDFETAAEIYNVKKMESYSHLFCNEIDPYEPAITSRELLRQTLATYPAKAFELESSTNKVGGWLNAARKRFGLAKVEEDKDTALIITSKTRLLQIYMQLLQTHEISVIRLLIIELEKINIQDIYSLRFRRDTLLLALANSDGLVGVEQSEIDAFLRTSTEADFWWQSVIIALSRNWVRHDFPVDWLFHLNQRGSAALQEVARDNSTSYNKIRNEWFRLYSDDEKDSPFPFSEFDDEIAFGEYYRSILNIVKNALVQKINAESKNTSKEIDLFFVEWEKSYYYITLGCLSRCLSDEMWDFLLQKANKAWGVTNEYYSAEFDYLFNVKHDHVQAEHCCEAWIAAFPDNDSVWFSKGELKKTIRQIEEARSCFLHSATLTNSKGPALLEAARCLCMIDKDIEAEVELKFLIEQEEPYLPAYAVLGLIRFFDQDYVQALTWFSKTDIDSIDKISALYPYILCLLRQDGWEKANKIFEENLYRLSDREQSLYITGATLLLFGTEEGCLTVAHHFSPLLKFEESWGDAIDIVMFCCFRSGNWQQGRDLALRALACTWGSESHALQLICSYIYTTQTRDLEQGSLLATELATRFPDSFTLCNLAGELAEVTGKNGETFFLRVSELLNAVPFEERNEYQSMGLAVALCNLRQFSLARDIIPSNISEPCNIFCRVLIACAEGIERIDELYSQAKELLSSAEPVEVKKALHDHLIDLELYGQRGLIPEWSEYQSIAAGLFTTETLVLIEHRRPASYADED